MYYVGLDVHACQIEMCVMSRGEVVRRRNVRTLAGVMRELQRLDGPAEVCFEASQGAGFVRDALRKVAARVVVANPSRMAMIYRSKRKNDRSDAEWLAKMLMVNIVPECYIPEISVRAWRQAVEHRRRLVKRRTGVKAAIRSHLRAYGLAAGRGLWTKAGLTWLAQASFGDPLAEARRDVLMKELADAEEALQILTRALDAKAKDDPRVQKLMTAPGVGPRTAEAMVAYVDDPHRFERIHGVGTYFGLVPRQDQSASVNRLGHITRQGPSVVRWLLTEAVWQGIRRSERLRRHYERVLRGNPERRKIAVVATAHMLARALVAMMKSGQAWNEAA